MKLEFLMCGSPTDAFWSQAAMFRYQLDALGDPYSFARVVLCLGAPDIRREIPRRWLPWFGRIDVCWASEEDYRREGDGAQAHRLYDLVDPGADISFLCDADTLLLNPFPLDFLEDIVMRPAICGVIAHYPPPLEPYPGSLGPRFADHAQMWEAMASRILGRAMPMPNRYVLSDGPATCPFYINHGLVAATPRLHVELYRQIKRVLPEVRAILDNDFYDQLGIAFAVEKGGLPHRTLTMRYNFPNDPVADRLYPEELRNVVLMHYLRTDCFDRHRIFASEGEFRRFMEMPLTGSNQIFRDSIKAVTDGRYPFPGQ